MKNTLLNIFMILISINCSSQSLLTYSGEYPNGTEVPGKATFSYFIKNDGKIKHGNFIYAQSIKTTEGYYNSNFSGKYKDNNKDGLWVFNIDYKDFSTGAGNIYATGKITLTANYINGLPNGNWTYSGINKSRNKELTITGYTWSAFAPETNTNVSVTFNNGTLVGDFKMNHVIDNDYENISGVLNNAGFCTNDWVFRSNSNELKSSFYKNIELKSVNTKIASGEVVAKLSFTENDIEQIKRFIDGQISASELERSRLVVDTISLVKERIVSLNTTLHKPLFLYEYIPGDKTYTYENDQFTDKIKGLYKIFVTKIELMKLEKIDLYQSGLLYVENNPKHALSIFEDVLSKYHPNLDDGDILLLNDKITQCKSILNSEDDRATKEHQLTEDKYKCKVLITNSQNSLAVKNKTNSTYFESNILPKYFDYKGANSDYVKQRDIKEEVLMLYNKCSIFYNNVLDESTNQLNKMSAQNGDIQILIKTVEANTRDLFKILDTYNSFILTDYEILFKYTVYNKEKSEQTGQNVVKVNKKSIYDAWTIVREKLFTEFGNSNDLKTQMNTMQQLEKTARYVLSFADKDSKEIENQLKGKTNYNEISEILNK